MDELISAGKLIQYKKGEILIRPFDEPAHLYIMVSGMVHSYTITRQGEKNVHLIYGPGEIFPLAWIIQNSTLNIYYEAVIDSEVARVKINIAKELIRSDIRVSNGLLTQTIKQFILYKARVDNLEYKFARERVAYRLLLLGHRFGSREGKVIVMPRFGQDEISNTTNVSRESVNRELKRFERLGYIEYESGKLRIINIKSLRREIDDDDSGLLVDELDQ